MRNATGNTLCVTGVEKACCYAAWLRLVLLQKRRLNWSTDMQQKLACDTAAPLMVDASVLAYTL